MMLKTSPYVDPTAQVKLSKTVLKEVTMNAVQAWRTIPPPETKKTTLSSIRQGNEEAYQDFVFRLEEAINRMLPPSERTVILLKQLA